MSEIIVGGALQMSELNTPTRAGELVQNVAEIYNIVNPRVGMVVYVAEEKENYVITQLKTAEIGGVMVPDAAVKSYELLDKHAIDRIKGVASDSNPLTDPFKFLGNYEGSMQKLWVALDGWTGDSTSGYEGFYRARNGNSIIEIVSYPVSYKDNYWSQIVKGKLKVDNTGAIVSSTNFNILSRVHNYKGAGWSNWEIIAGGDLKAEIVEDIEGLSGAITSEETRAKGAEQALELSINSEIVRAKAVEQELMGSIDEEARRAKEQEQALQFSINAEITRAKAKEQALDTKVSKNAEDISSIRDYSYSTRDNLDAEIARAKAVEQELTNEVNANADKIAAEEKRALAAELVLQEEIDGNFANLSDSIQDITDDIRTEESRAKAEEQRINNNLAEQKDAIESGSIIAGQAREIYSRNGKTITDSFLVRTTAGSGTVGDGVATLKSIGGNIVKNLVDGTFASGWDKEYDVSVTFDKGVATVTGNTATYRGITYPFTIIEGHYYYILCTINKNAESVLIQIGTTTNNSARHYADNFQWGMFSCILQGEASYGRVKMSCPTVGSTFYATKPVLIDLTETFSAGKEPTKEECDKLFGTMDALPQGLSIANPSEFKAVGYNQFNPDSMHNGKAVIPCLPCKVGTGENNGYCIHGEYSNIKVYFTPIHPANGGEEYMHELAINETTQTYVPQGKGYLIVEADSYANMCVHFLWSEDRDKHDYEPYHESVVKLPTIPEMSTYGIAGMSSSGTPVYDEIDLERGVYVKRIGAVDMGSLDWAVFDINYNSFVARDFTYRILSLLCANYTISKAYNIGSQEDKTIRSTSSFAILVKDSSYTTLSSFKAAMQGVMLYYELATPEEYPLPKVDNNYISSDYGVEQFNGNVPCSANNLYYMRSLAGETRNFLDKMYANTDKTDAVEVADYITEGIANNSKKADDAVTLALRQLYIAAGAVYDSNTGFYKLNGINDLTEADMANIYAYKEYAGFVNTPRLMQNNKKVRTLFPLMLTDVPQEKQIFRDRPLDCTYTFYNSHLEVIKFSSAATLSTTTADNIIPAKEGKIYGMFAYCTKLRVVYPINCSLTSTFSDDTFKRCSVLEELRFYNIKASVILSESPLISKDSILYIINNAAPTTAITITLHPDAFARLSEDADIVAALETQPLITLVSA